MPTIAFQLNLLVILTSFVWLLVFAWLISIVLPRFTVFLVKSPCCQPIICVLRQARRRLYQFWFQLAMKQHRVLSECISSILAQDLWAV